jgi:hypothetical protein
MSLLATFPSFSPDGVPQIVTQCQVPPEKGFGTVTRSAELVDE